MLLGSHGAGIALGREGLATQAASVVHMIVVEQNTAALLATLSANRRVEGHLHVRVHDLVRRLVLIQRQPRLRRVDDADLVQAERIDLNLTKRCTGTDRLHPIGQGRSTREPCVDRSCPWVRSRTRLVNLPFQGCFRSLRGVPRGRIRGVIQPHIAVVGGEQAATRIGPGRHQGNVRRGLHVLGALAGEHHHVVLVQIGAGRAARGIR